MSYVKGSLSKVYDELESGISYWLYYTSDSIPTVLGSGYISDATDRRLKLGDVVDVFTGTLTNFAATTGGSSLGAVSFAPTVGVTSRFTSQPTYMRCAVSAVGAAGTTPGAATLALVELPMFALTSNPRNLLDGGDATTNPWQRGTSNTGIVATNTYTADRWFMVAGSSSSATMTQTADTTIPGFADSFVWGRGQSSGIASSITVGQAVETLDSIRAQGQPISFSFWARANTGFTTNSSPLAVTVAQGFGTDQSASALVNGTWTSQSNVISASQVLTTTMTRYSFQGTVSNTATQLGVLLSYTAGNTTATTAENVIMNGLQLEVGGLTPYEHREIEQELAYCQRYYFQVNEPGTSGTVVAAGMIAGTNTGLFVLQLPVQMRAAPTVSVTNGSFGGNVIGGYVALTAMAAGSTHTVNYVSVTGALTAVSGQAALLISSSAATGKIKVSADL
jgi:hypothetical protein